jgi:hypothetical protein
VSNQDIEGNAPAEEAPRAPVGAPANLEQELAKERDARLLMRDRLRHTEALAAESHALRSRMADELARVTADRDRLRSAASSSSSTSSASASAPPAPSASAPGSPLEATVPLHGAAARPMTPRAVEWPLDAPPPAPPRRGGPWGALAMLGGLAMVVAAAAWFTGTLPGRSPTVARDATAPAVTADATPTPASAPTERLPSPTSPSLLADAAPTPANIPSGAVALPLLTPEAQLAAAPSAAGPAPAVPQSVAPAAAPAAIAARLRKALDGEGISAPVDVDAASGHVMVADPQSDDALRDRTDMLIRAVYAGASLPEPQIEHRWLSPKRTAQPAPAPAVTSSMTPAQAYAARHATQDRGADHHAKKTAAATVAEAEQLRPVLPEGRVTASCRTSLAGKVPHRADMTACMKSSCCSAGNGQAEDCRAYQKAYPFGCSAG